MPALPRFYTEQPLAIEQTLLLTDSVLHHIHVRRLKVGNELILFNGLGGQFQGTLIQLKKRSAQVQLHSFTETNNEPPYHIILAQGIASTEKMDWLIEKAVELGVSEIMPLFTQKSIVRLSPERAEKKHLHWQNIIFSACEQCERNRTPKLHHIQAFQTGLKTIAEPALKMILSPRGQYSLSTLSLTPPQQTVVLLIGPEGGFSEEEEMFANQQGFIDIHLGLRILRTETAGIALLSALAHRWQGWEK